MIGEWSPVGRLLFSVLPTFLQRATYWYPNLAPFALAISIAAAFGSVTRGRLTPLVPLALGIELFAVNSRRLMNTQTLDPFLAATIDPTAHAGAARLLANLRSEVGEARLDSIADSPTLLTGSPVFEWRTAGGQRWSAYYQITNPNAAEVDAMSIGILTSTTPLAAHGRLQRRGEIAGRHVYL